MASGGPPVTGVLIKREVRAQTHMHTHVGGRFVKPRDHQQLGERTGRYPFVVPSVGS